MEASSSAKRPRFSSNTFLTVANVVYLLLAMSLLTLLGCLPLVLALVLVPVLAPDAGASYPLFLFAGALSAPGVAASFAMFRDHPVFLTSSRRSAMEALAKATGLPDWIAAPYVSPDVSVAVFRPYFAAYRRVAPRALAVGLTFGVIEFLALYDAQLLMQVAWGQLLVPAMVVVAVIGVEAELIALNLVVEFPKAKWRSLLRNGYLLSVRRFVMLVVNVACLGVYAWGLAHSPILVGVFATGVLAFVLWAGVRWQSRPLALAMARESRDRNLIALYD
ncbi:hypothetical protein CPA40_06245 [Bifidobacterium callitrichos]|uniref:Beta-carotene 15,15'-monooxygenase n=1 Tax=Bifidobacterium callitrichos TaxID=762209 RepID=A0A2T3G9Z5_9BIFI|nr:hypothetical protein [Bifidobacterium callitrichos]PST46320.1 hypothetical protein CPA40_06245 [Bifidobacterium callitrichos]